MRLLTAVLMCFCAGVVAGQDVDPTNDSAGGASTLLSGPGVILVSGELVDGFDTDYYELDMGVGEVLTAVATPRSESFDVPDVVLYVMASDGSTVLLSNDDDGATENPSGLQYGSTVRFQASEDATYYLVVSGCCTLVGGHGEVGEYDLVASVLAASPVITVDSDPANDEAAGADDLGLAGQGATVVFGELVAPPRGLPTADVDYFAVELTEGDVIFAATTPVGRLPTDFDAPDTELGLVAPNGAWVLIDDNGGADLPVGFVRGSVIRHRAQQRGVYLLVVSGDDDENLGIPGELDGAHQQRGPYALTAAVLEAPPTVLEIPFLSPMMMLVFGLLLVLVAAPLVHRA